jgi:4-amino-4-deoxy-L-arabinose transferase-like glycosyltransferase
MPQPISGMSNNRLLLAKAVPYVGIGLLVLGLFLSRFIGLEFYPAPQPDEGFWCAGPKNFVMFGDALMDGRLHPFLSPVTFVLLRLLFSLVDPSLFTARLFSSMVGLLTVGIVYLLGRKVFSERQWILPSLFGACSFFVLDNRQMMIETQQVFWLSLTAYFYIGSTKHGTFLSGLCYGISLLVKINSVYIFPAFLCASYLRPIDDRIHGLGSNLNTGRLKEMIIFLVMAILVSFPGYLIAYLINPDAFITAYRFELDGQHFLDQNVLFHFGRFGVHPQKLLSLVEGIIRNMPIILILSIFGLFTLHGKEKSRADIVFAIWLITGSLFFAGQLFAPPRYFLTLFLPFSYFAAKLLNSLLNKEKALKIGAIVILGAFFLYSSGRIVRGVYLSWNKSPYERLVEWSIENLDRSDNLLAAPYIGLSLPNRAYDFYRMIFPYDRKSEHRSIEGIVDLHNIRAIIFDSEWKAYLTPEVQRYLRKQCTLVAEFGDFEAYLIAEKPPHIIRLKKETWGDA